MPIVTGDLPRRLSTTAGAAGDTTTQGDPNASLGKYMSTTPLGATKNDLFDDVTGDENAALDVEYRCVFVANTHGTLTLTTPKVWLSAQTAGGATDAIGLDPAGVVPSGQAGAQAAEVANESTAPGGVTFSTPTTKAGGLAPANIPAGSCLAIWVRRTATDSVAATADGFTLSVAGDTAA